jgi:hypothetical protein
MKEEERRRRRLGADLGRSPGRVAVGRRRGRNTRVRHHLGLLDLAGPLNLGLLSQAEVALVHVAGRRVDRVELLAVLSGPGGRAPSGDVGVVEDVDLVDRETLGLGDEQVDEGERDGDRTTVRAEAEIGSANQSSARRRDQQASRRGYARPDEADERPEVGAVGVRNEGDDEGDDGVAARGEAQRVRDGPAVEEIVGGCYSHAPVGSGGKRDTLGRETRGERLGGDDPGERSPGRGKGGDEDAGEGDKDLAGDLLALVRAADDTDDDLAGEHGGGSPEEDLTAAEAVDDVHAGEGADEVDGREDDLGDVGVREARGPEELDAVRKEELLGREDAVEGERGSASGGEVGGGRARRTLIPVVCWPIWMTQPMTVRSRMRSFMLKHSR